MRRRIIFPLLIAIVALLIPLRGTVAQSTAYPPITAANLTSIQPVATLGAGEANGFAVSNDGRWLALASSTFLYLYDLTAPTTAPRTLGTDTDGFRLVAFSPDSQTLVAGSTSVINRWSVKTGAPLSTLAIAKKDDNKVLFSLLRYSTDGKTLFVGTYDRAVYFVDPATGKIRYTITDPTHVYEVSQIDISADGKRAIFIDGNWRVWVWDLVANAATRVLYTVKDSSVDGIPVRVAYAADDQTVFAANTDGLRRYAPNGRATRFTFNKAAPFDKMTILAADISPDRSEAALIMVDKTQTLLVTVDLATDRVIGQRTVVQQSYYYYVRYSSDGKRIVAIPSGGAIQLFARGTDAPPTVIERDGGKINSVRWLADSQTIVTQERSGISLRNIATNAKTTVINAPLQFIRSFVISRDGTRAAIADYDGSSTTTITIYDLVKKETVVSFQRESQIAGLAFSGDGAQLIATVRSGYPLLFDAKTGALTGTMYALRSTQYDISPPFVTADGKRVLVQGDSVFLVPIADNPPKPKPLLTRPAFPMIFAESHKDGIFAMSYATESISIANNDGSNARLLTRMKVYNIALAFTPDDDALLAVTQNSELIAWSVPGGGQLASNKLDLDPYLPSAAFSPDGTMLAIVTKEGVVRIFAVKAGK